MTVVAVGSNKSYKPYWRSIDLPSPTVVTGVLCDKEGSGWLLDDPDLEINMGKRNYIVPTMGEIEAIPWNGLNAISTFSGCGGSCLGYRMAGYRVLWANEFVEAAQDTYKANHKNSILDTRDIREITPEEILEATGMKVGEIDLMDGSPPCRSFSSAGKRDKGWGESSKYSAKEQRTDDLFFEYARLLRAIQPKVFVAENVRGLVTGAAKGYFKMILKELKDCGYNVEAKLLNAQWLGVPQSRERLIFIGVRKDIGYAPVYPKPFKSLVSVAEALKGLENSPEDLEPTKIERFAIGAEWDKLRPGEYSMKYVNLKKPHPSKPSQTITAEAGYPSLAGVVHYFEKRKFTIPELRRICAFPDDFILTGSYVEQWERLGRSVPPLMMKAIASAIRENIFHGH
jgi:DNA (cytosine-5)-methyltransferase 1